MNQNKDVDIWDIHFISLHEVAKATMTVEDYRNAIRRKHKIIAADEQLFLDAQQMLLSSSESEDNPSVTEKSRGKYWLNEFNLI